MKQTMCGVKKTSLLTSSLTDHNGLQSPRPSQPFFSILSCQYPIIVHTLEYQSPNTLAYIVNPPTSSQMVASSRSEKRSLLLYITKGNAQENQGDIKARTTTVLQYNLYRFLLFNSHNSSLFFQF